MTEVLGSKQLSVPLIEIIKIMEAAALESNQELYFEYVEFEMPIRHASGSVMRHMDL